jgi:hypothetical protein
MSSVKSVVIVPTTPKNVCPICGTASYSVGGMHPQCAMQQADQPRLVRLRAAKLADTKVEKPVRQTWKKKCAKCGAQLHVRREVCECGHKFGTR